MEMETQVQNLRNIEKEFLRGSLQQYRPISENGNNSNNLTLNGQKLEKEEQHPKLMEEKK